MNFLKSMADRVFNKYRQANITRREFKSEYRMLGGDLVDLMLKDMEDSDLITIEKSNGNIFPKFKKGTFRFDILK